MPLALAASLVLVVGGAFLYELTAHSTQVMAAELTADHLKCFRVLNNVLGTRHDAPAVERSMASHFDWQMQLPDHPERAGLELVGAAALRRGTGGPHHTATTGTYRSSCCPRARAEELIEVMGHEASIWSVGTHPVLTRASLAPRSRDDPFVHAALR
jgi:hypothetical protein